MSVLDLYPTLLSGPQSAFNATGTAFTGDKVALDVNVLGGVLTGEFVQTGLNVAIKVSTFTVGDVEQSLPATALSGRNSMVITNLDPVETLYIGPTGVTADRVIGTTAGHEINAGEAFNIDIQDDITLYGIVESGKSILVKVTEVA